MRRAAGVDLRAKEAYAERLQAQGGAGGAAQASANMVSHLYMFMPPTMQIRVLRCMQRGQK